jgi:ATP-binding cassette subfamily B protein
MKKLMRNKKYTILGIFFEIAKVSPVKFAVQYIITIVSSVLLGLFISQLQKVFDCVAGLAGNFTTERISAVIWSFFILLMYKIISESLEILNGYLGEEYYGRCSAHFLEIYNKKVSQIPAIEFEKESELNRIKKAQEGASAGRGMLHVVMDILTLYIPYFVTIGVYFFRQDVTLLFIYPCVMIPIILTNRLKRSFSNKYSDMTTGPKRKKEEFVKYLSELSFVRDTRVNCLGDYFYDIVKDERSKLNKLKLAHNRRLILVDCVTKAITLLGFLSILYLLVSRMWLGIISIGTFGAIFYSLEDLCSMMEECLVGRIAEYNENRPLLSAFIDLMNRDDAKKQCDNEQDKFRSFEIRDVSFSYPNTNKQSLKNINLKIDKNDRIAVVGYNGSGKSTLAKVLAGLYKPETGVLLRNGKTVDYANVKDTSILFQDYNKYKDTIDVNVRVSDIEKDGEKGKEPKVLSLIDKVKLSSGENGIKEAATLCSKEFGGTDLSGGQWQRLATARMLYRDRELVILDEPTSAIDPLSEHELYSLFEKELEDKTALIITHRLMSVKFCNKIVVMNNGTVEAVGTHESLIKESVLYSKLYKAASNFESFELETG